jgi:hypothetical protein
MGADEAKGWEGGKDEVGIWEPAAKPEANDMAAAEESTSMLTG